VQRQWIAKTNTRRYQTAFGRQHPRATFIHGLATEATGDRSHLCSLLRQQVDCATSVDSKDQHKTLSDCIWSTASSRYVHPRSGDRGYGRPISSL